MWPYISVTYQWHLMLHKNTITMQCKNPIHWTTYTLLQYQRRSSSPFTKYCQSSWTSSIRQYNIIVHSMDFPYLVEKTNKIDGIIWEHLPDTTDLITRTNVLQIRCYMCIQWTCVLYSVVLTWQSNPPISPFNSPCNELTSVWSMFDVCIQSTFLFPRQFTYTLWTRNTTRLNRICKKRCCLIYWVVYKGGPFER